MGKRRNEPLGNEGMTLVEMMVVVVILGVVSISAFAGLAQINRMDAMSAAEKIKSALSATRMQTLSSDSEILFTLKYDSDQGEYCGEITKNSVLLDEISIGSGVSIVAYAGYSQTDLKTESITIAYNKSDGSFKAVGGSYDKIVVSGLKTKTVVLVNATGRCYIE